MDYINKNKPRNQTWISKKVNYDETTIQITENDKLLNLIKISLNISCAELYDLDKFMKDLEARNPAQPEFIQTSREVI